MKVSKQHVIKAKKGNIAVYSRICLRTRMRQTYMAARIALGCSSSAHETLEFVWEKARKLKTSIVSIKLLTSGFLQHTVY